MHKPSLESLRSHPANSFLVRRFNEKAFSAPYHYHPELELTLIVKGEGKRYVGNNMAPYAAGDLVLLGPDLPHCWKSENVIKNKINASSVVLQFGADCLGKDFFKSKEMTLIQRLLQKSTQGIQFQHRSATVGAEKLVALDQENQPFKKMLLFLEILHALAGSKEFIILNKENDHTIASTTDQTRMNNVMAYVVDHFKKQVSLDQAAEIAGMTPTAFCKYFKRVTRKTFIETVLEYRINYAMQQLVHTDHSVSHISFESGFGDVSHFYKTFRLKKKISPLRYRQKFRMDAFQ